MYPHTLRPHTFRLHILRTDTMHPHLCFPIFYSLSQYFTSHTMRPKNLHLLLCAPHFESNIFAPYFMLPYFAPPDDAPSLYALHNAPPSFMIHILRFHFGRVVNIGYRSIADTASPIHFQYHSRYRQYFHAQVSHAVSAILFLVKNPIFI